MIFVDSRVRVKDNTGVKRAKCLRLFMVGMVVK